MLLTSQENAVRQWVVDAISDCSPPLAAIPLDRVVWSDQDFPELSYPYALLSYTGTETLGADRGQTVNGLDELETRTDKDSTISITIVSRVDDAAPSRDQLAPAYIRELDARTHAFVADQTLTAADLAVRSVNIVPDVSRLQGLSQWESRAVLDLQLGHALIVSETPGVIDQVEVDGTTTPATPTRVTIIGPPP